MIRNVSIWGLIAGMGLGLGCGSDGPGKDPMEPVVDDQVVEGEEETETPYKKPHDFSDLDDECGLDTGFPGDVLCLKAPTKEEGFQLHMGPTNYDDPVEVESFLLDPGVENNECFYVTTPNEKLETYYERLIHMRPVSHHMFLFIIDGALYPDGYPDGWAPCNGFSEGRKGSLGGAEVPIVQYPPYGKYAPENLGIGRAVSKKTLIKMEIHAINTTDAPVMREIWTNLWYKPRAEVIESVIDVNVLGGFSVATPPGAMEVMDVSVPITTKKRILNLFGHIHSHAVRFTAWRSRGEEKLTVLEDYDWFDPVVITYDSITENLEPDPDKKIPGGYSGILEFEPGDSLDFQCEVHNDSDITLRYRNEALTGEMCNIFGEFVGHGADLTVATFEGEATIIGWLGD